MVKESFITSPMFQGWWPNRQLDNNVYSDPNLLHYDQYYIIIIPYKYFISLYIAMSVHEISIVLYSH
jgi:hypothetical protein